MITAEEQFGRELEIFRTEEEAGTQFLYAFLAVHSVAHDSEDVLQLLNTAPFFWNTCLGALQMSAFIVLGRIFDQQSIHNLDRLLRIAQDNPDIFSKEALGRRKQGTSRGRPEWLDEYLEDAYEPIAADFRRLRAHVRRRRTIYERNYRDIRNKFFAHKSVSDDAETAVLFSKGNNRELQQLFTSLGALYETLWQLFNNGRKPVLRSLRYSVNRMRQFPSPAHKRGVVQEKILHEAEQFLVSASKVVTAGGVLGAYPKPDISQGKPSGI